MKVRVVVTWPDHRGCGFEKIIKMARLPQRGEWFWSGNNEIGIVAQVAYQVGNAGYDMLARCDPPFDYRGEAKPMSPADTDYLDAGFAWNDDLWKGGSTTW